MEFISDVQFALGQMRKRWVLTLAAAVSLALCIGLNTAVFSVFNATLLRPLPFPEPDRIVEVFNTYPGLASGGGEGKAASNIQLYTVYKERVDAIQGFTLVTGRRFSLGSADGAERMSGVAVTPDFFETMRMAPLLGRGFSSEDSLPGNDRVVLLDYRFWQNYFGGDPDIVGQPVQIDGVTHTILGVLPESFRRFRAGASILFPYAWNPAELDLNRRHWNNAMLLGRLADDFTVEQAESQVDAVDAAFRESNPGDLSFIERSQHKSRVRGHQEERITGMRVQIQVLQAFALAILIIGALNIANLRMAEVEGRERELNLRRVLGGSRGALLRQLLTEAALVGALGGALGILTAWLSLDLIRNGFPGLTHDPQSVTLDMTVLGGAVILVLLTILIVGLAPVRVLWRLNYQRLLQEGGRSSAGGRGAILRASLGVVQTALAVLLLVATGLFVRSFWAATSIDVGFDAERVSTFRINLPEETYPDSAARITMVRRVLEELRALPGVERATGSTAVPIVTPAAISNIALVTWGEDPGNDQEQKIASAFAVTEDFFETMGIPLLDGRGFAVTDTEDAPPTSIVDRTFHERYLPDGAVGGRFSFGGAPDEGEDWPSVVGETAPISYQSLLQEDFNPLAYVSYYSWPSPGISFLIRSERSHETLLLEARKMIARIDPQLPVFETGRLDIRINETLEGRRAILGLTLLFGGLALLLAVAGIYGVQSHNLNADRRTIAVRAALGATPARLLLRTLLRAVTPVLIGLGIGLAIAITFAPQLEAQLFSVSARDPLTFASVALFLPIITMAVLLPPALTAARCDPGRVLHEE